MVFSSLTFLFAYLPIVLGIYFLVPLAFRNVVLLIVSLFFYGWGEPVYVLVMVFSIIINWLFGKIIAKYRDSHRNLSKKWLIACVIVNLVLLGFFKYYDFFIENLNALGFSLLRPLHLSLPIGISFYTFQTMSYPIDLYRKDTDPQKSLVSFGAYVCMFPQLIAGPIVRYKDVAKQLEKRTITIDSFYDGILRFCAGLSKKVLLANNCGQVYTNINALSTTNQSVITAWLGALFYTFQIYFDFSGYSDMAIGLGKMLGFDFLENFNYPYISKSVTEFWRRWHMSLSYWFRDYVYIPLGGNRHGIKRQIVNIMIVWLLTGFWHGASWNFVLWGMLYGIVLIFEKFVLFKHLSHIPGWLCHLYTMVIVIVLWMLFEHTDIHEALVYIGYLFGTSKQFANGLTLYYLRDNIVLLFISFIACTPVLTKHSNWLETKAIKTCMPLLVVVILLICTAYIVDASYNPFLYFRF